MVKRKLLELHKQFENYFESVKSSANWMNGVLGFFLLVLLAIIFYVFYVVNFDVRFIASAVELNFFGFAVWALQVGLFFALMILFRCAFFFFFGRKLGGKCSFECMLLMTCISLMIIVLGAVVFAVVLKQTASLWGSVFTSTVLFFIPSALAPLIPLLFVFIIVQFVLEALIYYVEIVILKQALEVSYGKTFVLAMVLTMIFTTFAIATSLAGLELLPEMKSFDKITFFSNNSFEVSYLSLDGSCKVKFPVGWRIANFEETKAVMRYFPGKSNTVKSNVAFYKGGSPLNITETKQALYFPDMAVRFTDFQVSYYCRWLNKTLEEPEENVTIDFVRFYEAEGYSECHAKFIQRNDTIHAIVVRYDKIGYQAAYATEESDSDFEYIKNNLYCTGLR